MKKTVKRLTLMAMVLVMCASMAIPAFAAPAEPVAPVALETPDASVTANSYWYRFNTDTTMYQYPSTDSAIVCYVSAGTLATISSTDGSWSYVCLGTTSNGTTGFWGYVKRSTLTYDHYGAE